MFGFKGEALNVLWTLLEDEEYGDWFLQTAREQPIVGDKVRIKNFNPINDGYVGRVTRRFGGYGSFRDQEYTVESEKPGSLPISKLNYWHLEVLEESNPIKGDTPEQRAFYFMMLHDRETMRKFFEERMMRFVKENLEGGELLKSEKEDALKTLMRLSKEHC